MRLPAAQPGWATPAERRRTPHLQRSRFRIPIRTLIAALMTTTLALAACAPLGVRPHNAATPAEPPSPLFAFLATADAGEVGTVEDPMTGATVQVIAGRRYHAASNKLCRQFQVPSPQGYEGVNEGLACKDIETGRWTRAPLIINPDDLSPNM